jgi:hypothetical protein
LVTAKPGAVTVASGGGAVMDATDILIPKLLMAQALSEVVSQGSVAQGSIYKSTTGEVLAARDKSISFLPLLSWKTWRVSEVTGTKPEFARREPMTDPNVPLEWQENGKAMRRDREMNFYILLPSDIEREAKALAALEKTGELPSPDDALLPCVITFTRTSYGAGKVLATHFAKAGHFNLPPYVSVLGLSLAQEKNDFGTFYRWEVTSKTERPTTALERHAAEKWCATLRHAEVRVDEAEDIPVPEAPVDAGFAADVAQTF